MNFICKIHFQNLIRRVVESRLMFEDQLFNIGNGYRMNEILQNNEMEIKNREIQAENFLSRMKVFEI